jgi:hypothetical protein
MGRARRLKRERENFRREAQCNLIARIESHGGVVPLPWGGRACSGPKISDGLAELIRPYSYDNMTTQANRRLVCLGVFAWNQALAPEKFSRELILDTLQRAQVPEPEAPYEMVEEMRQRKLQSFPDDRRLILDAELREQDDGSLYLAAAATREE